MRYNVLHFMCLTPDYRMYNYKLCSGSSLVGPGTLLSVPGSDLTYFPPSFNRSTAIWSCYLLSAVRRQLILYNTNNRYSNTSMCCKRFSCC